MDGLTELLARMGGDDDDDRESGLTDAQTVARLTEYADMLAEKHQFTYGQVLLHKYPSGADTRDADKPCVFLGYLDRPVNLSERDYHEPADFYSNATSGVLDCRVGRIARRGKFVVYLHSSAEYRPHPDFPNGAA